MYNSSALQLIQYNHVFHSVHVRILQLLEKAQAPNMASITILKQDTHYIASSEEVCRLSRGFGNIVILFSQHCSMAHLIARGMLSAVLLLDVTGFQTAGMPGTWIICPTGEGDCSAGRTCWGAGRLKVLYASCSGLYMPA